jgi:hypothetical protein
MGLKRRKLLILQSAQHAEIAASVRLSYVYRTRLHYCNLEETSIKRNPTSFALVSTPPAGFDFKNAPTDVTGAASVEFASPVSDETAALSVIREAALRCAR